jgi:hypothetical protein
MGPTVNEPDVGWPPDQPPLAVQLDASEASQLSVLLPPLSTYSGSAERETLAPLPWSTLTETCRTLPPPSPEQLSVKPVSCVIGPTVSEPLSDLVPPQPPDAVQLLALEADQVSVTESPLATSVLEAPNETDAGALPELPLLLERLPEDEELPLQPERTRPQQSTRPSVKLRPGANVHFRCAELGGFTSDDQLNCMDLTIAAEGFLWRSANAGDSTSDSAFVKEK